MILTQIFHFILQSSQDPQTQQLVEKLAHMWLPIADALAGGSLIFVSLRFGWLLTHTPEERGRHIRSWFISVIGVGVIFGAAIIGTMFTNIWASTF